jgi:adenosylmethionine---8-amino-7-oxononanoate aminotransferase
MKALAREQVIALDKAHVWHPYTAMDEYIAETNPLVIARASGSRLFDADGRAYLDGNSSWWCAALGHNHPRLVRALAAQAPWLCSPSNWSNSRPPACNTCSSATMDRLRWRSR